jgi:hypothetical protein
MAISSPFKLPQIYFLNTMRGIFSFKSLSQVIQYEEMILVIEPHIALLSDIKLFLK